MAKSIELEPSLDPGELVAKRRGNVFKLVRVAAVQPGLEATVARADFRGPQVPLAEPELALRRAAGENDVREALDLASDGLIGRLRTPDVPSVAPPATAIKMFFVAQPLSRPHAALEIHLELVSPVGKRRTIVADLRVGRLA